MKYEIKNWFTGKVIFECEANSLRIAIEIALMSGANLIGANLSGANLRYANLRYANLSGATKNWCIGNMREIHSMQLEKYMIAFGEDFLSIGCQQHTVEEWNEFTDDQISKMDYGAFEWWIKWKDFIFKAIEMTKEKK